MPIFMKSALSKAALCLPSLLWVHFILFFSMIVGCATETRRAIAPETVNTYGSSYTGEKSVLVVGHFQNRSAYMQGLFSSDVDRLGNQAKTILKTHLNQTNRFVIVDRENMDQLAQEAKLQSQAQSVKGARYAVTGHVTEFGRKVTGDQQLFGILGSGKKQIAYAKVAINIVDVISSEIVHSVQGAGEYALSNREVIGFGGTAGYDATLTAKVLNFAITEAVNKMVSDLDSGIWSAGS